MNYYEMSYQDDVKVIQEEVDGFTDWLWVKKDTSAWIGPKREWVTEHHDKYFRYLTARNVVITAGANCGLHARLFAKYFGFVYAFEPDPLNFHCLVNNCQADNVCKIMGALGASNRMVKLHRAELMHCGSHAIDNREEIHGTVPMFAIDSFQFRHCDLIQLDTEKSEPFVLQGAINTIQRCRPIVAIETQQGVDDSESVDILQRLNYERIDLSGSDSIWRYKQ